MSWFFGLFGGKKEKTSEEKKEPSVLGAVGLNKQTLADIGKVLGGRNALTVEEESKEAEKKNQMETQVAAPVVGMGLYARLASCSERITNEVTQENLNSAWLANEGR